MHCDIAARNILLGDGCTVKIGDFGLASVLPEGQDTLKLTGARKLGVRTLPPETLTTLTVSCKTDVWAFGVLLWEVASHGESPYAALELAPSEIRPFLLSGKRLAFPAVRACLVQTSCSHATQMMHIDDYAGNAAEAWDELNAIAVSCWAHEPSARPAAADLHTQLLQLRRQFQRGMPVVRDVGKLVAAAQ